MAAADNINNIKFLDEDIDDVIDLTNSGAESYGVAVSPQQSFEHTVHATFEPIHILKHTDIDGGSFDPIRSTITTIGGGDGGVRESGHSYFPKRPESVVRPLSEPCGSGTEVRDASVVPRMLSSDYKRPKFVQFGDSQDGNYCWVKMSFPGLKKPSCCGSFSRHQSLDAEFHEQSFLIKAEIRTGQKDKEKVTKYCCCVNRLPGPIDKEESSCKIIKTNIVELKLVKAEGHAKVGWKSILEEQGLDDPNYAIEDAYDEEPTGVGGKAVVRAY